MMGITGGDTLNFAYKRVSTEKQDLRRQEEAFKGIHIDKEYCDKLTGKNNDRPQLSKLRLEAQEGDHIYVESISRLGKNVDDLRQIVQEFKDKGVTIHFIKEDLFVKFINSVENILEIDVSHIYVLAKHLMGLGLSPLELMALAKKVGFNNRRYLKNEKELFEFELEKLLQEKHGTESLSLDEYSLQKCPVAEQVIIANYSLDHKQRFVNVPSLIENYTFSNEVLILLQTTHERVKEYLKDQRKSKNTTAQH